MDRRRLLVIGPNRVLDSGPAFRSHTVTVPSFKGKGAEKGSTGREATQAQDRPQHDYLEACNIPRSIADAKREILIKRMPRERTRGTALLLAEQFRTFPFLAKANVYLKAGQYQTRSNCQDRTEQNTAGNWYEPTTGE